MPPARCPPESGLKLHRPLPPRVIFLSVREKRKKWKESWKQAKFWSSVPRSRQVAQRANITAMAAEPFSIAARSLDASLAATQRSSSHGGGPAEHRPQESASISLHPSPLPPAPYTNLPSVAFSVPLHPCSEWPSPRMVDPRIRRPAPGSRSVVRVRAVVTSDAPIEAWELT